MPHDALGGLRGARGDPGARRGRPLVRATPGGGARLTPARRAALAFGATLLLTALAFSTFPDTTSPAAWAAGAALAVLGFALGAVRPALATCLLAAAAPLGAGLPRLLGDHSGAPLLAAIAVATLGAAFAGRLGKGEPSLLPPRLVTFAGAFLVLAAVSAAASAVRGETLWLLLHGRTDPHVVNVLGMTSAERSRDALLAFLGLLLLLLALDAFSRLSLDPDGRDRLLLFAAAGGAAALAIAAVERFLPIDAAFRPWAGMHRRAGTFTDPNALGVGIAILVPLLLAALVGRGAATDRARRLLAGAGLLAAPVALESSGSRTGFLLLGVAALAAGAGFARRRHVSALAVAAALFAVVGAAVLGARLLPRGGPIAAGGLAERLGAALSAGSFERFANHRVMFWRGALEMTADEPLSGVGLAGFPYEFPAAWAKRHSPVSVTDSATNALLDVTSECGLPGLVLALLAVVPLLVRAADAAFSPGPADPAARAAGAALLGLFVACQTGSHLRFVEVALLTSLVAGFLLAPRPARAGDEAAAWRPRRTAALVAGAGILGSLVALLPTRHAEAAFRDGPWIGVYKPRGPSGGSYWASPRVYRRAAGGPDVAFRLQNARPDGAPVSVSIDLDGRPVGRFEIPGGESRDVRVPVTPAAGALRIETRPPFVPRDLGGGGDRRTLAIRIAGEGL